MKETYDADPAGEPIADVLAREAEEAEQAAERNEKRAGPWGCGCPSCLACTGNCPRCGQRDLNSELGLCAPCDAELNEEVDCDRPQATP